MFGPSLIRRFLATKTYIGQFLGCIARIYRALANSEDDVLDLSRLLFIAYSESSYGEGYILSVERTFPELAQMDGLRELMLEALYYQRHCSR